MDQADNEYLQEEAAAEGAVPIAPIEIEIPEDIPDNPESPSPVPSYPPASPGPPFPVDPLGYNSEEEAFGGAEVQIFSSGGVARLQEWAEFVRGVRGQVGFTWVVPPISERFATFLQALYGYQWEERVLSPAGETIFEELRAALVGYHSQTAFQRAQFLRLMNAWTAQEFRWQLKKLAAAGGFWEVE